MLEAVDISKEYCMQSGETVTAVKNFSLKVEPGVSVAITGVSGSGKTTILNMLGGLISPSQGSVLYNGRCISDYAEREAAVYRNEVVAYILQSYGLIEEESVKYNVLLPLKFRKKGFRKAYDNSLYKEILSQLDLTDKENERVEYLSGGQKQRVAIARAIMQNAEIILADEPTGALDHTQSLDIINILMKLVNERNKSLVIVTHDKDIASRCDECINLEKI